MKPAAGRDAAAADMPAGRDGYLGVFTGGVSDELRAQLDLPEDCGLVVRRVAAGSPAEKAGLEANDILLEFGGREVTSPLDFAEMVQATKGGARVRLGIVRRGKRRTVDAVIGERDAVAGVDGRPEMQPGNLGGLPPQLQAQLLQQQIIQGQLNAAIAQGLAQAQAQVGGGPGAAQLQTSTVTINGRTQTTTVASDAAGSIELRTADGKRTIAIRDAAGKQVHAGPLDKEADYKAIPDAWRQKVRDVEARSRGVPAGVFGGAGNPL
jgi:serine protease Do